MIAGMRKSSGEIFLRTDDDIIAEVDWLKEIVRAFNSSDDIGGVSGPTLIPLDRLSSRDVFMFVREDNKRNVLFRIASALYNQLILEGRPNAIGRIFPSGAWSPGSNFESSLRLPGMVEVDYLEACNMALRIDLIERVGGFDLGYRALGDWSETDMSFRVRNLGYKLLFNPRAVVHHMLSRSGVFNKRVFACDIMMNFLYFYSNHLRPKTLGKFTRFIAYIALLQAYWIYKTISLRNRHYLGGLVGTVRGFSLFLARPTGTRKS
jgi:GT2 family glycosyltransferase